MNEVQINIEYLPSYNLKEWGPLSYAKDGDAGFDLRAAITEPCVLQCMQSYIEENGYPHERTTTIGIRIETCIKFEHTNNLQIPVPCGVKISVPEGFQLEVRPRSGLAFKHGLTIVNSPGTIDSGYTGQILAIMFNMGSLL